MAYLVQNTTMTKHHELCVYGGTDAILRDTAIVPVRGSYVCDDFSGSECTSAMVYINRGWFYDTYAPSERYGQMRKTWCHEIGHSVGLRHHDDDCMIEGDSTASTYTVHHIAHIDNDIN
jgi:hypothetical protein